MSRPIGNDVLPNKNRERYRNTNMLLKRPYYVTLNFTSSDLEPATFRIVA
jgi:hypothetical protein